MGESGGVIKWPTQIGEILGGIFLNCVGYFRGQLQWMSFCKIGELGGIMWPTKMGGIFSAELCGCNMGGSSEIIKWPTKMSEILGAILVNWVG
jgi:hypothetical protein